MLIDACRDLWMYISLGFFKQRLKDGEVLAEPLSGEFLVSGPDARGQTGDRLKNVDRGIVPAARERAIQP